MNVRTVRNVDSILIVIVRLYGLDLLIVTMAKDTDQGKEKENTFAMETVLAL